MKFTRKIDGLGRIVLPIDIRNSLHTKPGDVANIELVDNEIIISNAQFCKICGSSKELCEFHNVVICKNCIDELSKAMLCQKAV